MASWRDCPLQPHLGTGHTPAPRSPLARISHVSGISAEAIRSLRPRCHNRQESGTLIGFDQNTRATEVEGLAASFSGLEALGGNGSDTRTFCTESCHAQSIEVCWATDPLVPSRAGTNKFVTSMPGGRLHGAGVFSLGRARCLAFPLRRLPTANKLNRRGSIRNSDTPLDLERFSIAIGDLFVAFEGCNRSI